MNIAANPVVEADQTVYLKDYQKPSFLVDSINLDIQVFDEQTYVNAKLVMQRQTAGDLVLLGRDLELKSILLNGKALSESDYTLDAEQLVITIAAVNYYYFNNKYTGAILFDRNFMDADSLQQRLDFNVETIMRILQP